MAFRPVVFTPTLTTVCLRRSLSVFQTIVYPIHTYTSIIISRRRFAEGVALFQVEWQEENEHQQARKTNLSTSGTSTLIMMTFWVSRRGIPNTIPVMAKTDYFRCHCGFLRVPCRSLRCLSSLIILVIFLSVSFYFSEKAVAFSALSLQRENANKYHTGYRARKIGRHPAICD